MYLLERFHKLQKRAVHVITFSSYFNLSHSDPLFVKLHVKILPIFRLYEYNIGIFMFSFNKELLPEIFLLFIKNIDIYEYNTRSKQGSKQHFRVQYGRTSFSHSLGTNQGHKLWNDLHVPSNIKNCLSLNSFKRKFKKNLLLLQPLDRNWILHLIMTSWLLPITTILLFSKYNE